MLQALQAFQAQGEDFAASCGKKSFAQNPFAKEQQRTGPEVADPPASFGKK